MQGQPTSWRVRAFWYPPMPRGQAELVCTFEVDANGLLKVSAQDRASGRKAQITIQNSVGRLSSEEIQAMIKDAEQFKNADKDFSARHEAKSDLEAYLHTCKCFKCLLH